MNTREGVPAQKVSFKEAFWLWVKVALNSFGGPTGQIAVMHRYLVEENRWISESRFLHALNYCMLLPDKREAKEEAKECQILIFDFFDRASPSYLVSVVDVYKIGIRG
jgi:hypothetical protein